MALPIAVKLSAVFHDTGNVSGLHLKHLPLDNFIDPGSALYIAAAMESDSDYFTRRASDEMAAARKTSDMNARRLHLQMANRYRDLATGIHDNERRLGLSTALMQLLHR